MAEASFADLPPEGRPTVLLDHPQLDRLRPVGEALAREYRVEVTEDGGATFEALACGRCRLAAVAMAMPPDVGRIAVAGHAGRMKVRVPHLRGFYVCGFAAPSACSSFTIFTAISMASQSSRRRSSPDSSAMRRKRCRSVFGWT